MLLVFSILAQDLSYCHFLNLTMSSTWCGWLDMRKWLYLRQIKKKAISQPLRQNWQNLKCFAKEIKRHQFFSILPQELRYTQFKKKPQFLQFGRNYKKWHDLGYVEHLPSSFKWMVSYHPFISRRILKSLFFVQGFDKKAAPYFLLTQAKRAKLLFLA